MLQILFNGVIAEEAKSIGGVAATDLLGECSLKFFYC